jgi:hypothetical protein
MEVAADRLSARWYLGYDLFEILPDHSCLTKIRVHDGRDVFRSFFEKVVELSIEVGLVWGKGLYFDATKVSADASLDSIAPRFYAEEHLDGPFERGILSREIGNVRVLRDGDGEGLLAENAAEGDWIFRTARLQREVRGV